MPIMNNGKKTVNVRQYNSYVASSMNGSKKIYTERINYLPSGTVIAKDNLSTGVVQMRYRNVNRDLLVYFNNKSQVANDGSYFNFSDLAKLPSGFSTSGPTRISIDVLKSTGNSGISIGLDANYVVNSCHFYYQGNYDTGELYGNGTGELGASLTIPGNIAMSVKFRRGNFNVYTPELRADISKVVLA
ncbi:hypothetical protein [Companilactobacillus metriopterae]|uniref:hypothetical protein n=1 Tax=Companilactobacillus metriopterae TaxID=1909267 RepID=UPI0013E96A70|nr:hypothetical protein [Companilactobacillus metriopterae]